ncbi:MAG TPA: hypothetical protein VKR58_03105 [Aquella sp.]|nr:hypothetical protein [Aquella sp.]
MSDWELVQDTEIKQPLGSEWELSQPEQVPNLPFASQISKFLQKNPNFSQFLQKYEQPVGKFNEAIEASRLPSFAGGILQGGADTGISLANVPLQLMGKESIKHPNLQQYTPDDILSKIAFMGGEAVGNVPLGFGVYSALDKAIPLTGGISRIIGNMMKGGIAGGAVGEEMPFGRVGGWATGALAPLLTGLMPSRIGKNVLENKVKNENLYKKKYNKLFETAEKKGMGEINLPKANYDILLENAPPKYIESLKNILDKNFNKVSTREAHYAQSDLGKFINDFQNQNLVSPMRKAVNAARNIQKELKSNIHGILKSNDNLKLSNKYEKLTKGYKKDVVPYKTIPEINEYAKGDLSHGDLVSNLINTKKGKKFLLKEGNKYPEVGLHKLLKSPIGQQLLLGTGIGTGLGLAGLGGYEYNRYRQANP